MYTIQKGNHYACPFHIRSHIGNYVQRDVKFYTNCLYHFDRENDDDKSKLWGFTSLLNANSLRIAWAVKNEKIELYAYVHKNYKRVLPPEGQSWSLGQYDFNNWVNTSIHLENNMATFKANEQVLHMVFDRKIYIGWQSNVYFGGNLTAPHTMTLEII